MSSLINYEFIKSKFGMIVSIINEIGEEAKNTSAKVDGKKLIDMGKIFQKMFGTVVIRCFFGNIKLNLVNGKDPFFYLSDLFKRTSGRNNRMSSFLFGDFLLKFGIRKIDR